MKPKEVIDGLLQSMEKQQWEEANKYLAEDFTFSGAVPKPVGKKEWLGIHRSLESGVPDFHFNLHDVKEDGNKVRGKVQITGTHSRDITGPIPGLTMQNKILATGKKVALPAEEVEFDIRDGKVKQLVVKPVPGGGVKGLLEQIGQPVG